MTKRAPINSNNLRALIKNDYDTIKPIDTMNDDSDDSELFVRDDSVKVHEKSYQTMSKSSIK